MSNRNHMGFGMMMGGLFTAIISICVPPHDTTIIKAMIPVVILGAIFYESKK